MSCFPCFSSGEKKAAKKVYDSPRVSPRVQTSPPPPPKQNVVPHQHESPKKNASPDAASKQDAGNGNIASQAFTFRELATATNNFRPESLLGEGGFGRVYKGRLDNNGQEHFVAVKQLDRNGFQGNKEFLVEVLMLSLLHHENLVNLVGYCADGDQRLLVYEYMALGSLENHLLDLSPDQKPLDWYARMKIATGAAKGLEYLHDKANPPIIYRDLKSSNILLDKEFNPKLSDFGLAKLGPTGDKTHVSPRVMGTYGYCAPEYARSGQLTVKSDVFSFGVVLLELITGRRAIDTSRDTEEQNLITWAQPIFKDPKRFPELADPLLKGDFPVRGLNQAVAVAAMCLQEEAAVRPLIADAVIALSFLSMDEAPVTAPDDSEGTTSSAPNRPLGEHSCSREVDDKKLEDESAKERGRAIAEAKEWGSSSRGYKSQGSSSRGYKSQGSSSRGYKSQSCDESDHESSESSHESDGRF